MSGPRGTADDLAALEARLGHSFTDKNLLEQALSHPSLGTGVSYQRLEFLGDRVLGLVVSDLLYHARPDDPEGALSRRHTQLVRRETLAGVGRELGLKDFIRASVSLAQSGDRAEESALADVVEAIIAALYLDGGLDLARIFIEQHWLERLHGDVPARDPKSALQEWVQGRGGPTPSYEILGRTGPDHAPRFRVAVRSGDFGSAESEGRSRQDAERAAARALLAILKAGEKKHD